VEEPIEAVVKQLGLKPRQTVNEIARATRLSIDDVIYALISLTSADRKVAAITAVSLVGNERDHRLRVTGGNGQLLHPSPDLCVVDRHHHGAGWGNRIAIPAGGAAPEVTPPQVVVSATYPGASAQVVANTVTTPARTTDQRRAGDDLHVLGQRQ